MSQHLYLFKQFALRAIQQRFRGSVLGWGWIVGQPLLMMAVYTTVFGVIFDGSYAGQPEGHTLSYAVGIFLSLTLYGLFSDVLNAAPIAVLSQAIYVKKVRFPVEILPFTAVAVPVVNFLVQMLLVAVVALSLGMLHPAGLLPAVVLIGVLLIGCMGVAFWFAALGVFLRDIQQIAGVVSLVALYASAVFYSSSDAQSAHPDLWLVLRLNPLLHLVENTRAALLFGAPVAWSGVVWSALCALIALLSGWAFFRWAKGLFADVL